VSSIISLGTQFGIKQSLQYQPQHVAWFITNQALFNRVVAFYFEVIQVHEKVLKLGSTEALTALEKLTHTTKRNPHPVMPLSEIEVDIPAMFRRAAIHAALARPTPFTPISRSGARAKRKPRRKGRSGPPAHLCRRAPGTNQRRFTREC